MTDSPGNLSKPAPEPAWPTLVLLLSLVVGTGARLWLIAQTAQTPARQYAVDNLFDSLAWNLATGAGFTLDGATPSAHVGPGYPAVLASFYFLVGHRPDWVPYLHVLFDMLTALCIFEAVRLLFGRRVAALAAAAVYLYPAYWTFDLRIRNESLLTLLVALWLWVTVWCATEKRMTNYVIAGLVAGFTILCKPVVAPIALLLLAVPTFSGSPTRSVISNLALYICCLSLVVLPWSVRNYQAFESVLPVSTGVGVGLWMGSDPVSRGSWPMSPAMEAQIWEAAGITPLSYPHVMYEVAIDRELQRKGLARIVADPWRYLHLISGRVLDLWIGNRFYLLNGEMSLLEGFQQDTLERGLVVASYSVAKRILFMPVALLLALWACWNLRGRWRDLFPLYAFAVGITLAYVPFTVEAGRYVLPVLPCVFILAAAALFSQSVRWREAKA